MKKKRQSLLKARAVLRIIFGIIQIVLAFSILLLSLSMWDSQFESFHMGFKLQRTQENFNFLALYLSSKFS